MFDNGVCLLLSITPETTNTPRYTTTAGTTTDTATLGQAENDCLVGVFQVEGGSGYCYLKGGVIEPHTKQGVEACQARTPPKPPPAYSCAQPGALCEQRLGATHWNPCYAVNQSIPSLLDGAEAVASMVGRSHFLLLEAAPPECARTVR